MCPRILSGAHPLQRVWRHFDAITAGAIFCRKYLLKRKAVLKVKTTFNTAHFLIISLKLILKLIPLHRYHHLQLLLVVKDE